MINCSIYGLLLHPALELRACAALETSIYNPKLCYSILLPVKAQNLSQMNNCGNN